MQTQVLKISLLWIVGLSYITSINAKDKVYLLEDEREGLQIKIDAIRAAKSEVSLAYYAIYQDESGYRVLASCIEAARRGVHVRIIVESLASKLSKPLLEYLCRENISVQFFNRFHWKKMYSNIHSLHDKLLIVDNKYYITGGRNITNNYYSTLYPSKKSFVDMEILVDGITTHQATRYFNHLWTAPFASFLNNKTKKHNEKKIKNIKVIIDSLIQHDTINDIQIWLIKTKEVERILFVRDYYQEFPRTRFVSNKILSLIYEAQNKIIAETPYASPPKQLRRAMRCSVRKGARVRLVSNAAHATDVLIAAAIYANDRKRYLRWGVKAYEYTGPKTLHSKTMVIDDYISVIGSYNLDQLSFSINSEAITVVSDSAFAQQVTRVLDDRIPLSQPVYTTTNPSPSRLLKLKSKIIFAFLRKTTFATRPFI